MLSFSSRSSFSLALALVAVIIIGLAPYKGSAGSSSSSASTGQELLTAQPAIHSLGSPRGFVLEDVDGSASCRDATPDEALMLNQRDPGETLHVITPARGVQPQTTGLQITLRATQQLESFPDAKAAFLRAAATWQGIIQTPISIVIDVDFGPNRFGKGAYPPSVLGSTDPQLAAGSTAYPGVRSALVASAANAQETALYNSLPAAAVPTDLGSTPEMHCPVAAFRALGLLNAVADPTGEQSQLGSPPSIGFNSAFQFDFAPTSTPIDPNKYDFNAVATHEIGHALGFTSETGNTELTPTDALGVSVWDLYRFRPGVGSSAFTSGQRIESSGGNQVYYAGAGELGLSTGRPDGKSGDGFQASHWKSVQLSGVLIGIMDPAVPKGVRRTVSTNDVAAIHSFGYSVVAGSGGPPAGGGTSPLSSGLGTSGSVAAATPPACFVGSTQYTIQVPSGTTQLAVSLAGNQSDALLMRFGSAVVISGGQATADFLANASGTNQSLTVNGTSSPALQAGTYYIAVANCSTSSMNFIVTATVGSSPSGGGTPPAVSGLKADLLGNTLTVTGTATDTQNPLTQADVAIMDSTGKIVGDTSPFVFAFGASPSSFAISLAHMENYPSGVTASLIVIDSGGAHSSGVTAAFGNADPGGPVINSISFDDVGGLMLIKGGGFTGQLQLEINGVIVAPPVKIKIKGGGSKLKISASGATLNLHNGMNRVRMMNNGERSSILVLTL